MLSSGRTRRKSNKVDCHDDEREILNINYEDAASACNFANFNNLQKKSYKNNLEENVELSLELQIANSLKNMVTSSRNTDLSLLDVTIVQPLNGDDYIHGCVENTVALTSSKVKQLLEAIEQNEKRKFKILDRRNESVCQQCPLQGLSNVPLNKSKSLLDKKMIRKLELHRQKLKRKESPKYGNIAVSSDATRKGQFTNKLSSNLDKTTIDLEIKDSSSVTVLKPYKGRTQNSFKHFQDHVQVGDNLCKYTDKHKKNYPLLIPTKDSYTTADYNSIKFNEHEPLISNAPQIYATPKTFDKLKNIFECQNPENRTNNSNNKDNLCSCQHCELIGVLMDSQKKPFLSNKSSCVKSKHHSHTSKGNSIFRRELQTSEDFKGKHKANGHDSTSIIQELTGRLASLEKRVTNQEQLTVPKDYFKKIINKLVNKQLKISPRDSSIILKSIGTQYYPIETLEKELKTKKISKATKYRNVQIQQNDRRNYVVNPVLLQNDANNSTPLKPSSHEVNNINSKSFGLNPITAISDYFLKKRDSDKQGINLNSNKTKYSPFENFYKWGEEIIKPGFDLKTKIISLLAEQVGGSKNAKSASYKNINSKQSISSNIRDTPKMSSTSDCKDINSISKINMTQKRSSTEDKKSHPSTSNKTLKRMLNLMSEKIYNDHVKPTVETIKQEQRSINDDNYSQVINIKKAMDDVFEKINYRENNIKISNSTDKIKSKSVCNRAEWKSDFLEPLEIPSSIKSNACNCKRYTKTAKTMRKSGIPVRVVNANAAESISSSHVKLKDNMQLRISQLQSTAYKNDFKDIRSTSHLKHKIKYLRRSDKTQNNEKIKEVPTNQHTDLVINPNEEKTIQIKYMNPKASFWTDESSGSIKIKTSKYNNKIS